MEHWAWVSFVWFLKALPAFAGILLATLASALFFVKEMDEYLRDKRKARWCLAIVLSVLGIGGFISDRVQDAQEKAQRTQAERNQSTAIDGMKTTLQQEDIKNTAEIKYLEGQLSVFSQFGPAVMELAKASEENTRKEYETKSMSAQQLRDFVATVVKRMRDWSYRERQGEDEVDNKYRSLEIGILPASKDTQDQVRSQMAQFARQEFSERISTDRTFEAEFEEKILSDAILARNQLVSRLGVNAQPNVPPMATATMLVFQGEFYGPDPVNDAANYLEQFAKKLSP